MLASGVQSGVPGHVSMLVAPRMTNEISCGRPEVPLHGRIVHHTDFTYPHTVDFSCADGYRLKGRRVLRCGIDGQWSAYPPKCHTTGTIFPWWAVVITVVVLLPISLYILLKCYLRKHGRSNAEYCEPQLKTAPSADNLGLGEEVVQLDGHSTFAQPGLVGPDVTHGAVDGNKMFPPGTHLTIPDSQLVLLSVQNESLYLSGLSSVDDDPGSSV